MVTGATGDDGSVTFPIDSTGQLISREYVEQNAELHRQRLDYGSHGHRHADSVRSVAQAYGAKSLLDYGCGKQTLLEALKLPWARGYDPAVAGLNGEPKPADMVVCTDTLEHIEPDHLENVLDHLKKLARRVLFVAIHLTPAKKTLPDGRNTHLIVQPAAWWLWRLLARWEPDTIKCTDSELQAVLRVRGEPSRDPAPNNIRR